MDLATIVPFMLGPNITGSVFNTTVRSVGIILGGYGAFSQESPMTTGTLDSPYMSATYSPSVQFSASSSHSSYTNSGKVYPLSLSLNYIIKC